MQRAIAIRAGMLLVAGIVVSADRQRASERVPLAFFEPPARTFLARIDPVRLDPVGTRVPIGEYHYAAAASPDGRHLAVAAGGPGGGVLIVDIGRMEMVHRVHIGIAPEALAWLTPTRVLAAMQCNPTNSGGRGCGIALVDASSGTIVRRWPATEQDDQSLPFRPPYASPKTVEVARDGVVFLLGHWKDIAPARLVLITKDEQLRSVSLAPIKIGLYQTSSAFGRLPTGQDTSAGLAIDANGDRAFVVGAEPTIAEVDLRTMNVRYHEVAGLAERRTDVGVRRALMLPGGDIAVYGFDVDPAASDPASIVSAGVRIIDGMTWRARTLNGRATRMMSAAGSLIVYAGDFPGVTAYDANGRERFTLFADEQVREVFADGDHAYVITRKSAGDPERRTHVIDVVAGTRLRQATPPTQLIDLVSRE
jgi:hypothetical protein